MDVAVDLGQQARHIFPQVGKDRQLQRGLDSGRKSSEGVDGLQGRGGRCSSAWVCIGGDDVGDETDDDG